MSADGLAALPKVLLHDHLDGGLRPQTVLDLADAAGYCGLPAQDAGELAAWFYQGDESTSLEQYLEAFAHTCGVMQSSAALQRVAYEAVEDLAAEGVVYAELRFAPSLSTRQGLSRGGVIEAVLEGLNRAEKDFGLPVRLIIDAMRQDRDSEEVARVAAEFAGNGVVGFDLAGPEAGFPATDHGRACAIAAEGGLRLTIHAGEGDGVASIAAALEVGAERVGHGARLIEDTKVVDGEITDLGAVATHVFEAGTTLEVCPTSNIHTGMYPTAADHPIGALHRAGFNVTLNTDNRLMSRVTPTHEFALVVQDQGFDLQDLEVVTLRALGAAFCDAATRDAAIEKVKAGYN